MNQNTTISKSLEEKLLDIQNNPILNMDTKSTLSSAGALIETLKKKNEILQTQYTSALKAMIGLPIYWAHPRWRMEEHVITGIRYDESYWSDFFDTDEVTYQYTPQIVIEVDEGPDSLKGEYLAVNLGKNLFFDKEEALQHSKDANMFVR